MSPRITFPQRPRMPRLLLRSGQIARGSYCIAYEFEGEPPVTGEIVQPTMAEAWALWRVVLAAHERMAA